MKKLWAALLLAGLLVSPIQAETVTYLHTDLLGSVVLETDQNRNVVKRYEYEPYGMPRQAMADQPGYTGHVHDAGSGLVYMQQRYYDPEVGRFLSIDPVAVDLATGANFNRYWYSNNNPYKYRDPDGRAVETAWDVFNIGLGLVSLGSNLSEGNYGAAALDGIGVVVDSVAAVVPFVPGGAGSAIKAARVADNVVDTGRSGRGANKLAPDPNATGAHSTFKHDADGNITNTATYEVNPKNPAGFQETKRVDVTGKAHTNPDGTVVPTPHVKEAGTKGVRPVRPEEIPKR